MLVVRHWRGRRDLQVSPSWASESSDPACQNQSLQAEGKESRERERSRGQWTGEAQLNSGGAVEYPHLQAVFIVRLFCFCFEHSPVIPFQPSFVSSELFFSQKLRFEGGKRILNGRKMELWGKIQGRYLRFVFLCPITVFVALCLCLGLRFLLRSQLRLWFYAVVLFQNCDSTKNK